LGALESSGPQKLDGEKISAFYTQVASAALELGVAVSVVSIKGTSCTLEQIAKVAAITRGINHEADPLQLTKNFNFILQNSIVATDVTVKMILHQGLCLRDNQNIKEIGNATKESTITYEYGIKSDKLVESVQSLPFQVQINFTKLDGSKCVRAISKAEKITQDRQVAEQEINVGVVGLHSQAQAAKYAQEGNYTKAVMKQKANMRMVKKNLKTDKPEQVKQFGLWKGEANRLDNAILEAKETEDAEGLNYDSASDDESDDDEEMAKPQPQPKQKSDAWQARNINRAGRRNNNDNVANQIYQAQNPLFSNFNNSSNPLYKE